MAIKKSQDGAEYIPLMTEDSGSDEQKLSEDSKEIEFPSLQKAHGPSASRFLLTAIYSALAVSFLSFVFSGLTFITALRGNVSKLDTRTLERPSLYLGLERVPVIKKQLEQKPIAPPGHAPDLQHGHGHDHNMPIASDPEAIKPTAIHRVSSLYPTMSFTDDKWITLTEWDSMLVEFQLPYDLPQAFDRKKCEITFKIPPQTVKALMDRQVTIEPRGRSDVHVWEVSPLPPSEHNVTYNFKPTRISSLGSMEVGFDIQSHVGVVDCRAGATVTLELACPPKSGRVGCRVEFIDTYSDLGIALTPLRS